VVVEMLQKLNNGRKWEKIARSRRIAGIVQDLEELLKRIDYKIINHVRRKGNKATDFLFNWGSNEQERKIDNRWPIIINNLRWEELTTIINQDHDESRNQ